MKNEKLFTTEDGIDIYKGDKYYTVNLHEHEISDRVRRVFKHKLPNVQPAGTIAGPYINPKWYEPTGTLKYFGERKNAEIFVKKLLQN